MNPALEKHYLVPRLAPGGRSEAQRAESFAGGGGPAVARTLSALGADYLLAAVLGGQNGSLIEEELEKTGARAALVRSESDSPLRISVFDQHSSLKTVISEPGIIDSDEETEEIMALLRRAAAGAKVACLSGPPAKGAPKDVYARLVALFRAHGVKTVVDAPAETLEASLWQKPHAIKPNLEELSFLAKEQVSEVNQVIDAAGRLVARGVGLAAVSMGARGALLINRREAVWVAPPKLAKVALSGCGYSLSGALAFAMALEMSLEDTARIAVAASAASALTPAPGGFKMAHFEAISREVSITRLA
jgi:1-phosphofructokinase family hexose kinase